MLPLVNKPVEVPPLLLLLLMLLLPLLAWINETETEEAAGLPKPPPSAYDDCAAGDETALTRFVCSELEETLTAPP